MAEIKNTIPPMRVQRMGKKWRIVYDETRTLAKYGDGKPVDGGGFSDEMGWPFKMIEGVQVEDKSQGMVKIRDGQIEAMKALHLVLAGQSISDPEEEAIETKSA